MKTIRVAMRWFMLFGVVAFFSCGGNTASPSAKDARVEEDAYTDALQPDAGAVDALPDAPPDALPADAMPDAAMPDAQLPDAAVSDAAAPDASANCVSETCDGLDNDCDGQIDWTGCLFVPQGGSLSLSSGQYGYDAVRVHGTLIVDGAVEIEAEHFVVANGGTVACSGVWGENVSGAGNGSTIWGAGSGGGGAGHGGTGGQGGAAWEVDSQGGAGGNAYGSSAAYECETGSRGAPGGGQGAPGDPALNGWGGFGGGSIWIRASLMEINGVVNCIGSNGTAAGNAADDGGGGGGSGGSLCLEAGSLTMFFSPGSGSHLRVGGGNGGAGAGFYYAPEASWYCGGGGGGGAGGRIKLYCESCTFGGLDVSAQGLLDALTPYLSTTGGVGGAAGAGCDPPAQSGSGGANGTVSLF